MKEYLAVFVLDHVKSDFPKARGSKAFQSGRSWIVECWFSSLSPEEVTALNLMAVRAGCELSITAFEDRIIANFK